LRFVDGSGSKNEVFEDYFDQLTIKMREKYTNLRLIYVLDNLKAHKSSLIWKIIQDEPTGAMLFTPAHSS
jgi:hypothetical protein